MMSRIDSWHQQISTGRHFQNGHHNTAVENVKETIYDSNLTIMKSPKPATDNRV
jgi:hypothetical protein